MDNSDMICPMTGKAVQDVADCEKCKSPCLIPVSYALVFQRELRKTMTATTNLEQEINQLQKVDSIGLLAGGIAHDFNNLLQIILGHAELLMMTMDETSPYYESVSEIKRAALRSADLTRQLLAFSRNEKPVLKTVSLNSAVLDLVKLLKRLVGSSIVLKSKVGLDVPNVRIDTTQLTQIVTNLVVNARDAMKDGGDLFIETSREVLSKAKDFNGRRIEAGTYAVISVSDTGCGMTPEVMAQVFEPFFTTKAAGNGTGLGLAVVAGIIKKLKGGITVASTVGKGTTFRIYIPASTAHDDILIG